jgi:NitT/TauT family transport system substrate-binding protein
MAALALAWWLMAASSAPVRAVEIAVADYGAAPGGFVYAVAMAKGFFKEEGADVTGIISSQGGGTSVRNMIAGGAPYGDINPAAVLAAVQQGAKLKIVSDNVLLVADLVWAVKPDSPLKKPEDIKGRKVGYTNPKSTTEALTLGLLAYVKLAKTDVEMVRTGGFGEGVAALDIGAIDVAPIPEPLWAKFGTKYRPLVLGSDALPALANTIGVASEQAMQSQPDLVRAIIRGRRKAVQYLYAHPEESGDIVAAAYNLDKEVGRRAVKHLVGIDVHGTPYFGEGRFHLENLKRMMALQVELGAVPAPGDLAPIIDMQFLPDDLKKPE